jgi:hypothetical protein
MLGWETPAERLHELFPAQPTPPLLRRPLESADRADRPARLR